jgi:hypothetical protein
LALGLALTAISHRASATVRTEPKPLEIPADRALRAAQLGGQLIKPQMIVAVALPVVRR